MEKGGKIRKTLYSGPKLQSKKRVSDPETIPKRDHQDVSNEKFIRQIFSDLPDGGAVAVCSKIGDPTEGGWVAKPSGTIELNPENNNYLNCSSFGQGESFNVRKDNFRALHFLLLDDVGSKVPLEKLGDFEVSWLLETSPGNFQAGIILAEPLAGSQEAERLQKSLIETGLCDKGAGGLGRWARLPNAVNGKAKHKDSEGQPFRCRLVEWSPEKRYTPQEIIDGLNLKMEPEKVKRKVPKSTPQKPVDNEVITELRERGLYKKSLGSGKHDITCPWVSEHTGQLDSGAAYFEPSEEHPKGGFCCQHSHKDKYHIRELLNYLGLRTSIHIVEGDLDRIVDEAEQALARKGDIYQSGGAITAVKQNKDTGHYSVKPFNVSELTRQLSRVADWVKFDSQSIGKRCDPPVKYTKILFDLNEYKHLPSLAGLARQPYFREGGELVLKSGYDTSSKVFGAFDHTEFNVSMEPTIDEAHKALEVLKSLITEFHFVSEYDEAAALSAMFTAVVRPSLPHAPAFHVKAPVCGSGKSYLSELIGYFAGPEGNTKTSYPRTSEEASKVLLSLLLTSPSVVEFDDMDTDWVPHGMMLRVLTAEHVTERILGISKTATVTTRSLFLGSGNNVGPVRDMSRRVLTINLDPRCATPTTLEYKGCPVEDLREDRAKYVSAVYTIINAWRKDGAPKTAIESIASFGGAWTEYCRHPLVWLGLPDPATNLLEQVKSDPDSEALGQLINEWFKAFGENFTTVRKAVAESTGNEGLLEAFTEFPIMQPNGSINSSKLGWLLKKNMNRIVAGYEFQRGEADSRTAWRVAPVKTGGKV